MKKTIAICGILLIALGMCACGKKKNAKTETPVVPVGAEEGGYADTVVDEEFINTFKLIRGNWITGDGRVTLHIYKNEDFYYVNMQGEGLSQELKDSNMFYAHEVFDEGERDMYDEQENERIIEFNCNTNEGQYMGVFYVGTETQYIRFVDVVLLDDESTNIDLVFYPDGAFTQDETADPNLSMSE